MRGALVCNVSANGGRHLQHQGAEDCCWQRLVRRAMLTRRMIVRFVHEIVGVKDQQPAHVGLAFWHPAASHLYLPAAVRTHLLLMSLWACTGEPYKARHSWTIFGCAGARIKQVKLGTEAVRCSVLQSTLGRPRSLDDDALHTAAKHKGLSMHSAVSSKTAALKQMCCGYTLHQLFSGKGE